MNTDESIKTRAAGADPGIRGANPLVELQHLGQSVWHDNIRRDLLTSGALMKMIADGEVTGLTSNPTIFEQAISKSTDYDADLRRLAREGKSAEEIFYALAIDDIRNAADLFRPVFEHSAGNDGFVSIEVAPKYAHDTNTTIQEAHRLWDQVDRPNLMVKIPATAEGIAAIEQCICDGLNINVTLIFALPRYDQVMDAYLKGLVRRVEAGMPVDRIRSVASFFVSRVDSVIDALIEEKIKAAALDENKARLETLKGRAAIANAKLAFAKFIERFSTPAFAGLAGRGARRQRPLWASTSTKNPAYPDVYYIEALIGSDTVNTMPPQTIEAYRDHGRPEYRLDKDLPAAQQTMEQLARAGIDMDAVTSKLEKDGVAAFAQSFDSLLSVVEQRRSQAAA